MDSLFIFLCRVAVSNKSFVAVKCNNKTIFSLDDTIITKQKIQSLVLAKVEIKYTWCMWTQGLEYTYTMWMERLEYTLPRLFCSWQESNVDGSA